ncbi:MAG: hypothetical protein AN487_09975 [Anabaena sp. CRKS33]|jgi:hypothetical protein|nr:hypothetical protein [Dolichospermum circinale Clear-D4]OBQ37553.1 MAG: hypothetical protein AN487_09975 [Anabaena sp. CRKS33]
MTTNTASNQSFKTLLQRLGTASESQIKSVLAEREVVQPEAELTPEIITSLQQKIGNTVSL